MSVHAWLNIYIFNHTHVYTHNDISFSLKEENPAICNRMDETGEHYAK